MSRLFRNAAAAIEAETRPATFDNLLDGEVAEKKLGEFNIGR